MTRPQLSNADTAKRTIGGLCVVVAGLLVGAQPMEAQSGPTESEQFQARINEVARSLKDHPQLKKLSQQEREKVVEFISGNVLFVVLHELAHAAVAELELAVLGHEEDAADDFAALQLINVGSDLSHRVLVEAAKGWFYSERRDRRDGEKLVFYDEHSLDQVRAYNIVCLIVGSNPGKFTDLASEVKLPKERQETCPRDFSRASRSWTAALKPHLRPVEQLKTRIEVVYREAKGDLIPYVQGLRAIHLLETVAEHAADGLAWPSSLTFEMQSCGDINARWSEESRKLTVCYELAADFGELYRDFGFASANAKRRKSK